MLLYLAFAFYDNINRSKEKVPTFLWVYMSKCMNFLYLIAEKKHPFCLCMKYILSLVTSPTIFSYPYKQGKNRHRIPSPLAPKRTIFTLPLNFFLLCGIRYRMLSVELSSAAEVPQYLTGAWESVTMKTQKGILPIDGQPLEISC